MLGTGGLPWDSTQELGETMEQLVGGHVVPCVLRHRMGWGPRS